MSDFQNYVIRSLLSEARIRYETVEKTKSGLKPRLIEREGPTGLIMTTTEVRLHPENETRQFAIPVSDTPGHTRRILLAIASAHSGNANKKRSMDNLESWQALQVWIDYANHKAVVPYADALAKLIPPVAVRLRRDFTAILHLIEAHAILHQANRRVDKSGYIVAEIADYRAVRKLVNSIVSEGVDQAVPKTIRQTVEAIHQICSDNANSEHASGEKDDPNAATILQVAKRLRLDRSSASRRVKQALTRGHLTNVETKRGRPHRLVIGDPLSGEARVMPTSKTLRKQWKRMQKGRCGAGREN